jgi:hypothetical protein
MAEPLTELPPNFEIRDADEDFFCSNDVNFMSAGCNTASIDITGVMHCTIKWLNLCQIGNKDEATRPAIYHFSQIAGIIQQCP